MSRYLIGQTGPSFSVPTALGRALGFDALTFGAVVHSTTDWYIVLVSLAALGVMALVLVVATLRMSFLNSPE